MKFKITNKKFIIIVLVILIIPSWIVLTKVSIFPERLRAIRIQVLDEKTNEPVPNALVYRYVTTARIIFKNGIPITYYEYRDVIKEKAHTDNNGYVYFSEKYLYFQLSEDIVREYIDINLNRRGAETVNQYFNNLDKKLYNPIEYLKGALIESAKIELVPEENLSPPEYRKEEFNVILNGKSLLKGRDEVVVKLERW